MKKIEKRNNLLPHWQGGDPELAKAQKSKFDSWKISRFGRIWTLFSKRSPKRIRLDEWEKYIGHRDALAQALEIDSNTLEQMGHPVLIEKCVKKFRTKKFILTLTTEDGKTYSFCPLTVSAEKFGINL